MTPTTFSSHLRFPKLRAVDVRPQRQNGHVYYLLADPLELSDDSLLVPRPSARCWPCAMAARPTPPP